MMPPFHLAIPVHDLSAARRFYGELLGCREGRSDSRWVDFDFFGHQLVCHLVPEHQPAPHANPVDGHEVPVPHFGVVLGMADWERCAARLRNAGVEFIVGPYIRFRGRPGEQGTLFLLDPSGNAIEIKGFRDVAGQLFAT